MGVIGGYQRRAGVRATVEGVIGGYQRRAEVRATVNGSDTRLSTSC